MILFRPRFEKALREAVDLYSTTICGGYQSERDEGVLLRGGAVILRAELRSEILRRIRCERWVSQITLLAAVVGALAAMLPR